MVSRAPSKASHVFMLMAPVQVDTVVGDRTPALDDIKQLRLTTRVINEAMRLYPQPPVLIRRAVEDDVLGGFSVAAGSDIFISVWNIHRSVQLALNRNFYSAPHCGSLVCMKTFCHAGMLGGSLDPWLPLSFFAGAVARHAGHIIAFLMHCIW